MWVRAPVVVHNVIPHDVKVTGQTLALVIGGLRDCDSICINELRSTMI